MTKTERLIQKEKNMKFTSGTMIQNLAMITCILSLSACSGMSDTQQRTLSGAGIGAGVGAASTVVTGGCVTCGAAIGGAVGAGGGYVYDRVQKNKGN